jgi:hypothetical protein
MDIRYGLAVLMWAVAGAFVSAILTLATGTTYIQLLVAVFFGVPIVMDMWKYANREEVSDSLTIDIAG